VRQRAIELARSGRQFVTCFQPEAGTGVGALPVTIGRLRYHYRNDREFHNGIVTPFMIASADMVQISATMQHRPGQPEITATFPDPGFGRRQLHSELLSTVAFQNLLVAKIERCADILNIGHPGVETHLVKVIQLIGDELDR
jgi:hypothetical protein